MAHPNGGEARSDFNRRMWGWLPAGQLLAAEERKEDYHGPDDPAHRAVHDVVEHLVNNRVTDAKARRGLRDALDVADKAPKPKDVDGTHRNMPRGALRCGAWGLT